ncbi:hypothetical protein mvi_64110 (plasmid) [Methylobacterium indicum]|uniref:Uncharacterized protein n=1 Tax=Methylobacterium indicum TaxID=1775910 RepID=A0A8H9CAZ5_9HYPH|nr:hypothetical protein mvi_64110 [Methylobacterium indicum]
MACIRDGCRSLSPVFHPVVPPGASLALHPRPDVPCALGYSTERRVCAHQLIPLAQADSARLDFFAFRANTVLVSNYAKAYKCIMTPSTSPSYTLGGYMSDCV